MEALFTSRDGGDALRKRILELIHEASALSAHHRVELRVMTFAFTDGQIGCALANAATRGPSLTVRLLADWSQRSLGRGQQTGGLDALRLPNVHVRYTKDQPYVWDAATERMRWSYHASRGLLHHKTCSILLDGRPWRLICGSSNWTGAAARSYENILILEDDRGPSFRIMSHVEGEFAALWSDGRASLSADEAQLHYRAILDEYRRNPTTPPAEIGGLAEGQGAALEGFVDEPPISADDDAIVAFAGRAERNRAQYVCLRSASGRTRAVPLTIGRLALETISSAAAGDTIKIAMYGMSARVPEYGALIDAARRGVRIFVLLDRLVGSDVAARLRAVRQNERLPIEVRTVGRTMHQKYILHAESATVVTGTANMSTDASCRHYEHRMRIRGDAKLAAQFAADFDEIWARISQRQNKKEEGRQSLPSANSEIASGNLKTKSSKLPSSASRSAAAQEAVIG